MTVGFLYGAGAQTLIFVTGTSGKYPKLFVSRQEKTKVSGGYPEIERGEKAPTPKISALLRKRPVLLRANFVLTSEKLEKAGTVDFKKHPARKVGTRSRECRPKVRGRFAFPGARNPRICSISRFGKIYPAIFPRLSQSFPREPPNASHKQPQPSRVF